MFCCTLYVHSMTVRPLGFEWDEAKADTNVRKHGVSFLEASSVFEDEYALFMADPAHSDDEDRFLILGKSLRRRMVLVAHCYREGADVIRIISARKASAKQRREYEGRNR